MCNYGLSFIFNVHTYFITGDFIESMNYFNIVDEGREILRGELDVSLVESYSLDCFYVYFTTDKRELMEIFKNTKYGSTLTDKERELISENLDFELILNFYETKILEEVRRILKEIDKKRVKNV